MGLMDKLKGAVQGRGKQLGSGVDRANTVAKSRMNDKYDSKLDTAAAKAKEAIAKVDRKK